MKWLLRGLGLAGLYILAFFLLGYITMLLWNWLMPFIFNLPVIDYLMATGLVLLSKILFGSLRLKAYTQEIGPSRFWKAKWDSMSKDEKDKFKQEFAERCKHKWGKKEQ